MRHALSGGVWANLRQQSVGVVSKSLGLGLLLALGSAAWANNDVEKNIANEKNWAMQAGDMNNQRYSRLGQINKANVDKLRVAWTFSTGVLRGHEGSPLVVDGVMFLHSPFPNKVFAIDLDSQKILWKYEPKQDSAVIPQMCCDTVNRGVAYAENKVILQQADSTLVALNAKTGKVEWSVKNGDAKLGAVNTNAPHIFKDKVITGISGGEWGVRGFIAAYNLSDGKLAWKGYSVGPDSEMLMNADAAQLMRARCATCLQQLMAQRGDEDMANTRVPQADVLITQAQDMHQTGRLVKLLAAGHSSSPGALAVLDEQSGVVFAGAWLEMQHLPDLRDARLSQWLSALTPWLKEDDRLWVPAHGPVVTGRQGLQMQHYLQALQTCVQDHVDQGTSLIEMDKACGQSAYATWANYESQHPRNVVRLYLQLEREALLGSEPAVH